MFVVTELSSAFLVGAPGLRDGVELFSGAQENVTL